MCLVKFEGGGFICKSLRNIIPSTLAVERWKMKYVCASCMTNHIHISQDSPWDPIALDFVMPPPDLIGPHCSPTGRDATNSIGCSRSTHQFGCESFRSWGSAGDTVLSYRGRYWLAVKQLARWKFNRQVWAIVCEFGWSPDSAPGLFMFSDRPLIFLKQMILFFATEGFVNHNNLEI